MAQPSLLDALRQYLRDAAPGGALNPEVTGQGLLDAGALASSPVPVVGDVVGLLADVNRMRDPAERTPMNYGLAALGLLPFVPSVMARAGLFKGSRGAKAFTNQKGFFIGPSAKTWDAAAAARAQEMANKGVDARKIWADTGTFKGVDGKWRQEIPDNDAKWLANLPFQTRVEPMDKVISHDALYEAYPETKRLTTIFGQNVNAPGGAGSYHFDKGLNRGVVNIESGGSNAVQNAKSVGLHEIQHYVQDAEGWARGGSPGDDALKDAVRKIYSENIGKFSGEPNELMKMAKENAYRRMAGEVEARATQARMGMSAAQRRAMFPLDSYDVPIESLLFAAGQ